MKLYNTLSPTVFSPPGDQLIGLQLYRQQRGCSGAATSGKQAELIPMNVGARPGVKQLKHDRYDDEGSRGYYGTSNRVRGWGGGSERCVNYRMRRETFLSHGALLRFVWFIISAVTVRFYAYYGTWNSVHGWKGDEVRDKRIVRCDIPFTQSSFIISSIEHWGYLQRNNSKTALLWTRLLLGYCLKSGHPKPRWWLLTGKCTCFIVSGLVSSYCEIRFCKQCKTGQSREDVVRRGTAVWFNARSFCH